MRSSFAPILVTGGRYVRNTARITLFSSHKTQKKSTGMIIARKNSSAEKMRKSKSKMLNLLNILMKLPDE